MRSPCQTRRFDVADALLVLDELSEPGHHRPIPGLAAAWEAAWIACLTHSSAWAAVAESAFQNVLRDCVDGSVPPTIEHRGACRCAPA